MAAFIQDNNGDDGNKLASLYTPFGNQANLAISQGWIPETNNNGIITYRSKYGNAFNNVVIPNKGLGHIALVGHPDQKFDIVIRDKDGNIEHTIYQGVSTDDVQRYITGAQSMVAQRNNSILSGANMDKMQPNGTYAAVNTEQ